jgi:CheY-like chemotaxis protein
MTDAATRILLVEEAGRAKALSAVLEEAGYSVTLAPTAVAALREVLGGGFALLVSNTTIQRQHDGLKLIQAVQEKVQNPPPILVQSSSQDPAVIKQVVKAGVADYVLYQGDAMELLPRVEKAIAAASLGERLIAEATQFLGPAARVLIEKGATTHLRITGLSSLQHSDLPGLFAWIREKVTPILKDRATALMARLESSFPTKGSGA